MKKYYFGLAALFVLTVVFVVITLAQGKSSKRDEQTSKKVESISTKLMDYVYQQNSVPSSLNEAGIQDVPSTITYAKLDSERFKFCAYFDRASSSFDAGPLAFLTGLVFRVPTSEASPEEETPYLDSYSLAYAHKKGQNCQTVKNVVTPASYDNYDFSNDPSVIN
ncbi:hypothetical protein HYW36_02995 [Candidatus Saccharibacteria bacterium]|nr:hypothetical protein [Candidatus Saccharibacteria bacterium]